MTIIHNYLDFGYTDLCAKDSLVQGLIMDASEHMDAIGVMYSQDQLHESHFSVDIVRQKFLETEGTPKQSVHHSRGTTPLLIQLDLSNQNLIGWKICLH